MLAFRQFRHVGLLRQRCADRADGVPPVRITPLHGEGAWADQVRSHVSPSRQDRLKCERCQARRDKVRRLR